MKFFSNDAKETTEDQAHDDRDLATPGSVEADSATVPQQRAGSPWNDAPGTDLSPDEAAARDDLSRDDAASRDDTFSRDETAPRDDTYSRDDSAGRAADDRFGDGQVHPGPETDTDEVDLPLDDQDDTRDRTDVAGFGDRTGNDEGDTAGQHEAADTYRPDGTVTTAADTTDSAGPAGDRADADDAVRDEGDFDSPQAVEPVTGEPSAAGTGTAGRVDDDEVTGTSADFEPAAVATTPADASGDTSTDATPAGTSTDATPADASADATPADAAPIAVPGSVEEPKIDRLFTDGDSFAERFRDIQLRFVDSPKDATAEAATLVGEAVDKLTSALRSQRESLSSKSDDTERLRVELRGYRDMLNRLTAL